MKIDVLLLMKLSSVPHMQAARNCLVGQRNVVKVADYSLALYTSPRKPSRTVVSIRWAAPELIVQQPLFTTKSDVWSFGKSIVIAMAIYTPCIILNVILDDICMLYPVAWYISLFTICLML